MSDRRLQWLALIVSIVQLMLLIPAASRHSAVWDEVFRIQSGIAHLQQGDFRRNPGNPPLQDLIAAAPVFLLADSGNSDTLSREFLMSTDHHNGLVVLGRSSLLIFVGLATCTCLSWAQDLYGRKAALCVLCLWCFDPLILAHGAFITGDMCATSAGIVATYAFWKWMQQPSLSGAVFCGMALGFALLSKYVWVVMPVLWAILWTVRRFVSPRPERWPLPGHLAVMVVMAIYVVNAGYAFELTFQPWHTFQFNSPALQRFTIDPQALSNVSAWLGAIPVPLPRHFIMGMDAVAHHVQTESMPTYVHGAFYDGNVWWFYLYGLLVKMPLGTWLLLAVAAYARLGRPGCFTDLMLWLPAITILVFVSWVTQFKMLRYILPMLPFVFIWIGHAFVWAQEGDWWRKLIVCGALAWSVLSSLSVYPHSLSYFNEAAGGTANGHNHLIRASYDWGQDLLYLRNWVEKHPNAQPLYVSCYGMMAPQFAGISSTPTPQNGPRPGWYAISASVLRGVQRPRLPDTASASSPDIYLEAFFDREPVDRVAYSIFIFHLDCAQANAMRATLGLELLDCDEHHATATL